MKKYLISLVLLTAIIQQGFSQDISHYMTEFSKKENVEKVKIGRFMMTLGKILGGVHNTKGIENIHSMEVFNLDNNFGEDIVKLKKEIANLKDGGGYETLMKVQEEDEMVRILIKKEEELIREIVFICLNNTEQSVIKMKGKIKESDIEKMMK